MYFWKLIECKRNSKCRRSKRLFSFLSNFCLNVILSAQLQQYFMKLNGNNSDGAAGAGRANSYRVFIIITIITIIIIIIIAIIHIIIITILLTGQKVTRYSLAGRWLRSWGSQLVNLGGRTTALLGRPPGTIRDIEVFIKKDLYNNYCQCFSSEPPNCKWFIFSALRVGFLELVLAPSTI